MPIRYFLNLGVFNFESDRYYYYFMTFAFKALLFRDICFSEQRNQIKDAKHWTNLDRLNIFIFRKAFKRNNSSNAYFSPV